MKKSKSKRLGDGGLSDGEISAQIKQLVSAGRVAWTSHAEVQMAKRGVDKELAKECLLVGEFYERPHVPNRRGPVQYVFSVRAKIDRQRIEVVASLHVDRQVVVVTVKRPN